MESFYGHIIYIYKYIQVIAFLSTEKVPKEIVACKKKHLKNYLIRYFIHIDAKNSQLVATFPPNRTLLWVKLLISFSGWLNYTNFHVSGQDRKVFALVSEVLLTAHDPNPGGGQRRLPRTSRVQSLLKLSVSAVCEHRWPPNNIRQTCLYTVLINVPGCALTCSLLWITITILLCNFCVLSNIKK